MSAEAIAAFMALGITVISSVVLIMRGLAKVEANLRDYFEKKHETIIAQTNAKIDESRNMFGEAVKAVREHADRAHTKYDALMIEHQRLELYLRDHYVSIPTFDATLKRIETTIGEIDEKVDRLITGVVARMGLPAE